MTPAKDRSMSHKVDARSSKKEVEDVHWEAGRGSSNVVTFCFPFPYSTAFHMLLVNKLPGLLEAIRTKSKKVQSPFWFSHKKSTHSYKPILAIYLSRSQLPHITAQQGHYHLIIIIKPHAATQTWLSWSILCPPLSPTGKLACSLSQKHKVNTIWFCCHTSAG